MWVWVEPILGWVIAALGVMLVAAGGVYGKRSAIWLGRVIGAGIVDTLRTHWSEDMSSKLSPIYAELQIGDGTEKWPNGSDTLPETMQTIYDRQRDTYFMVQEMQRQLESVLIDRPHQETKVRAEVEGDG